MGTVRGWVRRLRERGGDGDNFEELDGDGVGTGGDGVNNVSPCTPLNGTVLCHVSKEMSVN